MHKLHFLGVAHIFQVLPTSNKALQTCAKSFIFNLVVTGCLVALYNIRKLRFEGSNLAMFMQSLGVNIGNT